MLLWIKRQYTSSMIACPPCLLQVIDTVSCYSSNMFFCELFSPQSFNSIIISYRGTWDQCAWCSYQVAGWGGQGCGHTNQEPDQSSSHSCWMCQVLLLMTIESHWWHPFEQSIKWFHLWQHIVLHLYTFTDCVVMVRQSIFTTLLITPGFITKKSLRALK